MPKINYYFTLCNSISGYTLHHTGCFAQKIRGSSSGCGARADGATRKPVSWAPPSLSSEGSSTSLQVSSQDICSCLLPKCISNFVALEATHQYHCYFAVNIYGVFIVWLQRKSHLKTKFIGQIEVMSFSVINSLLTWLPNFFPDKTSSFLQLPFVSCFLPNYPPNEPTFHLFHYSASQTLYSDLKCCQML